MAKDIFHRTVKQALISDGWTITHDPFALPYGDQDLYVDLGAERLLAAQRADEKIAVEVKSFIGRSQVDDLENALGQYLLYRSILQRKEPDRILFLAIAISVYNGILSSALGRVALEDYHINLLVFDPDEGVVFKWIA